MDSETNQNLNPVPGLNQNIPSEPKFLLRLKMIILALVGLLILAGLSVGGYYLSKSNNPSPVPSPAPWPSLPVESPKTSPSSSPTATTTVQGPTSLQLISQIDITPAGQSAYRPDVTTINGELWLAYNTGPGGPQSAKPMVQRLDESLNKLGQAVSLDTATETTTDIRVDSADGQFWMGYESVLVPQIACNEHFLNVASYTSSPMQLSQGTYHIAKGCAINREFMENPTGLPANPEIVDDPTPFYHNGVRYILTRAWGSRTVHHLRKLNADLSVAEDILLDTSTLVPNRQMSQNALLDIDGKPFLVAGFSTGVWIGSNTSDLYILPLSDDLRSFSGQAVRLAVTDMKFPTRVTRARYVNGTLIINFNSIFVGMQESDYLGLFDVANGFSLLSQIQIHDHEVVDNHSSFDIIGDRLYLFQQQDGQKISAKIFQLE